MGIVGDFLEEFGGAEPVWSAPVARGVDLRMFGAGVYVLWKKGVCVYVGSSLCLARRLATHFGARVDRIVFDKVEVFFCAKSERLRVEREMTVRYKPRFNHGTGHGRQKFTLAQLGVNLAKLIAENPAKVELKNGRGGIRRI